MENRILTLNEAEKVTGGGFTFDSWYEIRRNEANLKCPACESTGKLESLGMYWEGYINIDVSAVLGFAVNRKTDYNNI